MVGADILFLSEMKLDEKRMQWFRWALGLVNMVVKDCEGKGEGIAVLWRRGRGGEAGKAAVRASDRG